jgi:hypothetical protein
MKTEEKELLNSLFKHISKVSYFDKLKEVEGNQNHYTVAINTSSYNELNLMVCDILKVCILALDSESPHISSLIPNPEINILRLLELSLQLMPNELELLDELHETHLKLKKIKSESEVS